MAKKYYKPKSFSAALVLIVLIAILIAAMFNTSIVTSVLKFNPNLIESDTDLEVHFVDVGQGDATLIRFPDNTTMLVDAAESSAEEYLTSYINNIFLKDGETGFDYIMLTHSDADHSGGMEHILNTFTCDIFFRPNIYTEDETTSFDPNLDFTEHNTLTYKGVINKLEELSSVNKLEVKFTQMDTKIDLGTHGYIHILSPVLNYYDGYNEYSPIMMLESNGKKVMLTGDAYKENELEVLNNYNNDILDVDILKLGHHGSKTSTHYDFLEALTPSYAIASAGKSNDYGHPSAETMSTIDTYNSNYENDITTLATLDVGHIMFSLDVDGITYTTLSNSDEYLYIDLDVEIIIIGALVVCGVLLLAVIFKNKIIKTK